MLWCCFKNVTVEPVSVVTASNVVYPSLFIWKEEKKQEYFPK